MNILVLNSSEKCFATQSIILAGQKHGHKMIVLDPAYFTPLVSNVESGYDRVYDLLPKTANRITMREVDAIIPRIGNNLIYNSYILEHLTLNLGIYSIQSAAGLRAASNKFHTLQMVSRHGIKTPITLYVKAAHNIDFLIEKVGGLPFVLKYNYGSQGAGVMLMETKKSAVSTIEGLLKNKADFIIQQYIESKGQDIRAIVIGDHVVAAYRRTAPKGDFRSNLSLGGTGELVNLSMDDQIICVKASKAIDMEVSGVDLIKDSKGTTYLNEINSNFGFKGQKITGINIGEKLITYIENRKHPANVAPPKAPDIYFEQLRSQNRSMFQKLQFFTENKRIQELFEATKGKDIDYRDLTGRPVRQTIKSSYDLYKIIFDTFIIK